jgi:hypothetical protein
MAQQGYGMMATGAQGEAGLGSQSFNQGITNLSNALQAAGMPQAEAQQILNSLYQQQLMSTQAGLGMEQMIASWLPKLIGTQTTQSQGSNQFGLSFP